MIIISGGTWTSENKVRPGIYINFTSQQDFGLSIGDRGVVAICEPMSWGPVGTINQITAGMDTTPYCGYRLYESGALFLHEIFKGTDRTNAPETILLYRPAAGSSAAATVTTGTLTATAAYPGTLGNNLTIIITEDADSESTFTVETVYNGSIVDTQTGATVSDLTNTNWITWSGTGALTATAGAALAGGADGTVQTAAYSDFLTALEPLKFDVLIYDGSDTTVMAAYKAFVDRLANSDGQYRQLVAANITPPPDDRFVINVMTGATLSDGTQLTPQQVCWWAGGATAGAIYNEALTYAVYPNAVAVPNPLTNEETIAALQAGQFVLSQDDGRVKVEQDINSLTTFTTDISKVYRKNRIIRLCNTIANDLYREFSDNFIGIVNNNEEGRTLFKNAIVGYLLEIQQGQGIQNFTADDVEVLPGNEPDSIIVNLAIQTVDAVEKIYITITVS